MRYETPLEVARTLARHAPKRIDSILDPAVGQGALLEPLAGRLASTRSVVCLDADASVLGAVKARFGSQLGRKLRLLNADFLVWSAAMRLKEFGGFHCVVMNPPFSAKKEAQFRIDVTDDFPSSRIGVRYMPVEAAFLLRAVRLLRPGGRLLALLPRTLVSSTNTAWLRELLISTGCVRYVRELPAYTFKSVEARIYLFVYEAGLRQGRVVMCNHELRRPEKLIAQKVDLTNETRLDFSFLKAHGWYRALEKSFPQLTWTPLEKLAFLYRGGVDSPEGARRALHTCDYRDGFWRPSQRRPGLRRDGSQRGARRGDLLMKRVARNCAASVGLLLKVSGRACSDCLLIIRPRRPALRLKVLFTLRVLLASSTGAALVERGTGARYISATWLARLRVPINLASWYPRHYDAFKEAVRRRDIESMRVVERYIQQHLMFRVRRNNSTIAWLSELR